MSECDYSVSHTNRGILFKQNNSLNAYILSNGTINTGTGTITTPHIQTSLLTLDKINGGGTVGLAGQVLTSGGTGNVYWSSTGAQTLPGILSNGSFATAGQSITLSQLSTQLVLNDTNGAIHMTDGTHLSTLQGSTLLLETTGSSVLLNSTRLQLTNSTSDLVWTPSSISINGITGTSGQVLGKSGNSLSWITASSSSGSSLSSVLSAGSTATLNQSIQLLSDTITYPGGLELTLNDHGAIRIVGQIGTTLFTEYDTVLLNGKGLSVTNQLTTTAMTTSEVSIQNATKHITMTVDGITSENDFYLYGPTLHIGTTWTTDIQLGWKTATSASQTTLDGQVEFTVPPQSVDPLLGNDLATKGYVDTLIGNYSGNGLSLYFNLSSAPTSYPASGTLGQTLISINSSYYTVATPSLGTTLIASFTTDIGYPNTTTVPVGLWSMLLYGYTTSAVGQLFYHFNVIEVHSGGTTTIATSGYSSDINTTTSATPNVFSVSVSILTPYVLQSAASRLRVEIYSTGTGMGTETLTTLFGGLYYSFVTTTLSGATSILTSNNVWTGTNTFSVLPTAPTASQGTSTTALATTSFVDASFLKLSSAASTYATLAGLTNYVSSATLSSFAYVQKSVVNTWSAIQSFVGISTSSILSSDITLPVNLYTTQTSGLITLGNTTTSTVRINNLNYSQGTINPVSVSNNVLLGNLQTTGELHLGNSTTRTGAIFIGSNSCPITVGGVLNVQQGITSSGTLQLRSATGINTNNSSINTGSGTITSSSSLLVGIGTTLGISLSTSFNYNQIAINTNPGTAGQVLTSGGPAGGISWSTVSGGGGGAVFPDIELVITTSGNVSSTLDVTNPNGYVWLTPTAGSATGRQYFLPVSGVLPGYTVTIRNNSGASWLATNSMTNGSIYGAGSGNQLTIGNNVTFVIKYMGLVTVGAVARNIWTS